MAKKPFLMPVVIDNTSDDDENVPEKFREVQWTRLPLNETPSELVSRVRSLLSPEPCPAARLRAGAGSGAAQRTATKGGFSRSRRTLPIALTLLAVAAVAYLLVDKLRSPKQTATAPPATPRVVRTSSTTATTFNPPPHSVAVLPFVNMSGDKDQEYFSDGLSEELLNDLARINGLQVAARTSVFSFKGKDTDIATIARELNVRTVLEGSVRRSAHSVRVGAQLIDAVTGFHLWTQAYDRGLGDVLKLQALRSQFPPLMRILRDAPRPRLRHLRSLLDRSAISAAAVPGS